MKKRRNVLKTVLRLLLTLFVFAIAFITFYRITKRNEDGSVNGPYAVKWVSDGDTIIIQMEDEEKYVRLIGIDTPESINPNPAKNTPQGKTASDYTRSLLDGRLVYLEYDEEMVDKYGRILAYVYLDPQQEIMVEELLLKAGMARTLTIEPNVRYEEDFEQLEREARKTQSGFWAEELWD